MASAYKVSTIAVDGVIYTQYASSEGAAKKLRRELAEAYNLRPLKDVEYEQVDLPTSKAGIIDYLNENHSSAPVGEEAEAEA